LVLVPTGKGNGPGLSRGRPHVTYLVGPVWVARTRVQMIRTWHPSQGGAMCPFGNVRSGARQWLAR
jgi:hypothetical protein